MKRRSLAGSRLTLLRQESGLPASLRLQRRVRATALHVVLILLGVTFFLPFFWLISSSLKRPDELFDIPPIWFPPEPRWRNYVEIVTVFPFFNQLKNTLIICALSVIGSLVSAVPVAYSFSRIRWAGRDAVFMLVLSTMMLPYQVTLIPIYILFRKLGWVGTYAPLTVPLFFGTPFFIFLLRQFFLTLPTELDDAAIIDGCSELGVLWRIILPLATPALATVALFQFLWAWNDFLGPLIFLNDEARYTLAIGLSMLIGPYAARWELVMAGATLIVVPVVLLFFFTQRTFIQGIALTGVKG